MKVFTVIDTRTNSKKVWESTANTLAELKAEMRTNGISTDNIVIQEGLTKTEFMNDNSVLPHDVNYKGTVTNNLVFRVTLNEKNIKSGANRAEVLKEIVRRNLQKTVKEAAYVPYTNVKTDILLDIIKEDDKIKAASQPFAVKAEGVYSLNDIAAAFDRLIDILLEEDYLSDDEVAYIHSGKKTLSVYDDKELDSMFD